MAARSPFSSANRAKSWSNDRLRTAVIAVTGFSAANAIAGGIGVMVHGLGLPIDLLDGTPFTSFTVPGLILALAVGGSMLAATVAALQRSSTAGRAAMIAGAVMLGWIVIEAWMISDGRGLQVAVALFSLFSIALGWRLERQSISN